MKLLLGMALAVVLGWSAFGQGRTSVDIDGNQYSNITKVYVSSGGKITIITDGGGASVNIDKLPQEFLASWKINTDDAKNAETKTAAEDLERAINSGCFRAVESVVYDIRKPSSGWVKISNAKVLQVLDDGAILDLSSDPYSAFPIHVRHLADTIGDTDTINFTAKLTGSYSYVNKLGDDRTIRDYDAGRMCGRDEIPASVLNGDKAFDVLASRESSSAPSKDVIASLPESSDLKATGSGFLITDDGYLITNNHVVENATKIRVITSSGTFDAKLVIADEANDLALVKVNGQFSALPIATSRTVQLGCTVATVGFPDPSLQGFSPKLAKGEIASLSGIKDDPRYFQMSVPVQPGNSGGALVDEHGNVVGVVAEKLNESAALAISGALPENVNYAVKSSLVLSFLESSPQVTAELKNPITTDRKFEDVVKSTRNSAVLVLVY